MKAKESPVCVIGVDYGTQSARAQLLTAAAGEILSEAEFPYPHGVMSKALPDGTPLEGGHWALVHPQDYWNALVQLIHALLLQSQINKALIKGLSIAATACTLVPVDASLTPLCCLNAFMQEPHAYAKLWKHHRAEEDARKMTRIAKEREESFIDAYGGKISSEWVLPKILEVMREAPEVFQSTDAFMQISDWLDSILTGQMIRGGGISSFKALYSRENGYPSQDYLAHVHPLLPDIVKQKLRGKMIFPGEKAGELTSKAAELLGLMPGVSVASGHTDAHAAALGAGILHSGDYLIVIGTSSVTHFLHHDHKLVPGVNACVRNGLLPDLTCYTAGQACVGDMLEWFVRLIDPEKNSETYAQLEREAALLTAGDCGLLALDWWNGNRCLLGNNRLSGLIMGMTLCTSRADIYRALMESIAFGQRMIRDQYEMHGLSVERIILCGGIAAKSPLMCQIMADVLGTPVEISSTKQATALGAGMCAAAGLGIEEGGYACLEDAVRSMSSKERKTVYPEKSQTAKYDAIMKSYRRLHDFFGIEEIQIMENMHI